MFETESPNFSQPSARARKLLRGAYDLHLHIDPDVIKRRITDVQLARRFAELGMAGFVLKSHYVPTAEREAELRRKFQAGELSIDVYELRDKVRNTNNELN